jgi:glutathione S-transferase
VGLTFYDCPTAPSPRRARMVLAEKRVPHEVIEVDLRNGAQFSDTFRAINPRCTVPALQLEDGSVLSDNASIARWLEEVYPDPPLMGTTPLEKAMVAEWNWRVDFEGLSAIMEVLRNTSKSMKDRALPGPDPTPQIPELAERGRARAMRFFKALDARLGETAWLGGDSFSVADIGAYVFVEFARWVKMEAPGDAENLAAWHEAIKARPSGKV